MRLFYIFLLSSLLFAGYSQTVSEQDTVEKKYSPGDHELLIMPTAYTMEQGSGYFSSYEIFFLNFTYAMTSSTHIGAFFLFPITDDFLESITLGIKQNYFRSENFQGALWGSYTIKEGLYLFGNVFSAAAGETSFHAGFGYAGHEDDNIFLILLGIRHDFSKKVSGIVEYTNAKELMDVDFNGLISFGIRFRSESAAWEIAGVRPLEDTGDFLMAPLLKATFYF